LANSLNRKSAKTHVSVTHGYPSVAYEEEKHFRPAPEPEVISLPIRLAGAVLAESGHVCEDAELIGRGIVGLTSAYMEC